MTGQLRILARVCALSVAFFPSVASPLGYVRHKLQKVDALGIDFEAPPVVAYLEDSSGRVTGVDFTRTVTPLGAGDEIKEIPNSRIEQQGPIGMDDDSATVSAASQSTEWGLIVYDGGAQTYTLVAQGVSVGIAEFGVGSTGTLEAPAPRLKSKFSMLAAPGIQRRFLITVDRSKRLLSVSRQVSATLLTEDLNLACSHGYIQPEGVCQSLRAKVAAVTAARQRGATAAAKGAAKAFLEELKAQGAEHVAEPALTILREEAESILSPLPLTPNPKINPKTSPSRSRGSQERA